MIQARDLIAHVVTAFSAHIPDVLVKADAVPAILIPIPSDAELRRSA
jgi:hypothetical protein